MEKRTGIKIPEPNNLAYINSIATFILGRTPLVLDNETAKLVMDMYKEIATNPIMQQTPEAAQFAQALAEKLGIKIAKPTPTQPNVPAPEQTEENCR
ncbi:MAG: hypothetical protein FWC68_00720 [Oscillospiraceae bacterium]|nr:hypothetical protein [Oscillospiraceae bacterium]